MTTIILKGPPSIPALSHPDSVTEFGYLRIIAFSLVTDSNGTLPTIDGVETIALLMVSGHPGWGRGTGGGTKRSIPPIFSIRSTA